MDHQSVSLGCLDALRAPRALPHLEAALRLLIGQALAPGSTFRLGSGVIRWLPRRQRACPSAALDERVDRKDSTRDPARPGPSHARSLPRMAAATPGLGVPAGAQRGGDHRCDRRRGRVGARARSTRSSCSTTAPPTTPPRSRRGRGRAGRRARRRSCPRPDPGRARATRCGSRWTRAPATSSAGSTPTCATSAASTSSGCARRLLAEPDTMFVKAYYTRSFEGAPTGGGRVTELVARPLLSLLFPKLADIVQPLGGEYAARRDALEVLPFVEGWGVELGLLVDVVERFGRDAVAQVDLDVREHRNRPLDELGPQALAVMATALRRAGCCRVDGAVRRAAARRARRQRRSGTGRGARASADDHGAGVPSAFLAASIAASSTSNAARVYASLDCQTRSVSASTCDVRRGRPARRGRRRSTCPAMIATSRRRRDRRPTRARRRRPCPRGSTRRACPRP